MKATNKDLNALTDGILGVVQPGANNASPEAENDLQAFRERQETTDDLIERMNLPDKELEALLQKRAQLFGRKRGTKNGQGKPAGNRATFIVSKEIVRKLKYIALVQDRTYTAVVSDFLLKGISDYETAHGAINI